MREGIQGVMDQAGGVPPHRAILGCTHFPLVEHLFRHHLPPATRILSQPQIVADSLEDYLVRRPRFIRQQHEQDLVLLTTGEPDASAPALGFSGRTDCRSSTSAVPGPVACIVAAHRRRSLRSAALSCARRAGNFGAGGLEPVKVLPVQLEQPATCRRHERAFVRVVLEHGGDTEAVALAEGLIAGRRRASSPFPRQ